MTKNKTTFKIGINKKRQKMKDEILKIATRKMKAISKSFRVYWKEDNKKNYSLIFENDNDLDDSTSKLFFTEMSNLYILFRDKFNKNFPEGNIEVTNE